LLVFFDSNLNKRVAPTVVSLLSRVSVTLLGVWIARLLGESEYGDYVSFLAALAIMGVPANAGQSTLAVRVFAQNISRDRHEYGAYVTFSQFIWLIGNGIVVLALWGYHLFFSDPTTTRDWSAYLLLPFAIFLSSRIGVYVGSVRGSGKTLLSVLPEGVIAPLSLFLLIIFFDSSSNFGIDATVTVLAKVLSIAVVSIFSIAVTRRCYVRLAVEKHWVIDKDRYKRWLRASLPMAFLAIMTTLSTQVDLLMLAYFRSSPEVGVYHAATRGAELLSFPLIVSSILIQAEVAAGLKRDNFPVVSRLLVRAARICALLSLFGVLLYLFFGSELLAFVFGPGFRTGYVPLVILSCGYLISNMSGLVGMALNMGGFERYTARALGFSAALNIILNYLMIPEYGVVGASLATGFSIIVWNLAMLRYAKKAYPMRVSIF